MLRRCGIQSGVLLVLGALIAGQTGPCGAPTGQVTSGNTIVGVWRATYNDPFVGPTTVDLTLQPDGNFTETYQSAVSFTYISGPYYVDFAGTPGLLRLQVLDWEPKEFCGPLGCTPIRPIAGESWNYALIDNNNLRLVNFYCTDATVAGCTLNHARR